MSKTLKVNSEKIVTFKACTEAAYPGTLMLPAIDFQFSEARIEYSGPVTRVGTTTTESTTGSVT